MGSGSTTTTNPPGEVLVLKQKGWSEVMFSLEAAIANCLP